MNTQTLKNFVGKVEVKKIEEFDLTTAIKDMGIKSIKFVPVLDKTGDEFCPLMQDGKIVVSSYITPEKFAGDLKSADLDVSEFGKVTKRDEQVESGINWGPNVIIEFESGMIIEKSTKIVPEKQIMVLTVDRLKSDNASAKAVGEPAMFIEDRFVLNHRNPEARIALAGTRCWNGNNNLIASSSSLYLKRKSIDCINQYMSQMLFSEDSDYVYVAKKESATIHRTMSSDTTSLGV